MVEKKAVVFLAKFFALFLLLQTLIFLAPLDSLENGIAELEAGLLSLERQENLVVMEKGNFEISANCTGLVSAAVLASIVFSLKKPDLKKKILIFLAGSIALLLLNLVRVYIVLLSSSQGIGFAETMHVASWYAMAGAIIIAWFYLTRRITEIKDFSGLI